MKYVICQIEQRGEVRIAIEAKAEDSPLRADEIEITGDEVTDHVYSDRMPEKPGMVGTFGINDQSYRRLNTMLVRAGLVAF